MMMIDDKYRSSEYGYSNGYTRAQYHYTRYSSKHNNIIISA